MPLTSAAARSLAFAVLGFGSASALAQSPNVMAFNPISGIGLPGGPEPTYGAQAAYPIVDTVGPTSGPTFNPLVGGQPSGSQPAYSPQAAYPVAATAAPPTGGLAFNPWQQDGAMPQAGLGAAAFDPGQMPALASGGPVYTYNPGSGLPAPPRGPIESRIVAIPERGTARIPRDLLYDTPPPAPAMAPVVIAPASAAAAAVPTPPPAPAPTRAMPAAPTPVARPAPPPAATPVAAPPRPAASAPQTTPPQAAPPQAAPAQPNRPVAITTLPPDLSSKASTVASIPFSGQSADLSDTAKAELERVAKNMGDKGLRQIELRAYASSADPDGRKIALARALVVRSFLIDQGVKSRIEVGSFSGDGARVDILVPNP